MTRKDMPIWHYRDTDGFSTTDRLGGDWMTRKMACGFKGCEDVMEVEEGLNPEDLGAKLKGYGMMVLDIGNGDGNAQRWQSWLCPVHVKFITEKMEVTEDA